ncbi:MAG: hypothetical protein AAFX03_01505 [Pseudomonadota bacterium]
MRFPIDDGTMACWLRTQVRVLEAWREELAMRPDIDLDTAAKLERHYAWLTGEVARLEQSGLSLN